MITTSIRISEENYYQLKKTADSLDTSMNQVITILLARGLGTIKTTPLELALKDSDGKEIVDKLSFKEAELLKDAFKAFRETGEMYAVAYFPHK